MELTVLDIQRMSSEDGPGLRITAFLKGCSLACRWCHNPESISFNGEIQWLKERCLGCHTCENNCPTDSLKLIDGEMLIDRNNCTSCFACTDVCPGGAMELKGYKIEEKKLCRELLKDRAYFDKDGGITLSGGEPLLQTGALELLKELKSEGVSTAVDTCGLISTDALTYALQYADIVLYDIKFIDSNKHKEWTSYGNNEILSNFKLVNLWALKGGRLWVRTPIIPGATDTEENIAAIGSFLRNYEGVERWELCAFNNLCKDKYTKLGIDWEFNMAELMTKEKMEQLLACAKNTNACRDIRYTGALRAEDDKNGQ
ncbi:MAG: glycyl-radical enzyme activating protein [Eubacteriales bacterium]